MTREAINELKKYTLGRKNTEKVEISVLQLNRVIKALEKESCEDAISRQAVLDAFHTWFRDGFDEDKWWNSTHVLAAIEGIPSVHQKHEWETCFDCPLSHGCPKIKGCTNEQAIEYASKIPNDCPLSAQPSEKTDGDTISRQAALDIVDSYSDSQSNVEDVTQDIISDIVALPPVTPQPKWIPVSERLPEDLEPVNITWVNHEPEPYYHDIKDKNFVATGIHYRDQWYWYSTTCADYLGEYGSNEIDLVDDAIEIVAWMPLPDPYKPQESEDKK